MCTRFPGIGRKYFVDFVAFRVVLSFNSLSSLTYANISADGLESGGETVAINIEAIGDDVFLVTWQEADKSTVVHVEDFRKKTIITNITNRDLSFETFRGTFAEIRVGDRASMLMARLSYTNDILPLFRDQDAACMTPRHIPLRNAAWMCIPANAARVYARLADKTMPKDGPWPLEQIAIFKQWMDEGCNP